MQHVVCGMRYAKPTCPTSPLGWIAILLGHSAAGKVHLFILMPTLSTYTERWVLATRIHWMLWFQLCYLVDVLLLLKLLVLYLWFSADSSYCKECMWSCCCWRRFHRWWCSGRYFLADGVPTAVDDEDISISILQSFVYVTVSFVGRKMLSKLAFTILKDVHHSW